MIDLVLKSTIKCPDCGHQGTKIMPTDSCQYIYECESCRSLLKPKQDDCCVFCSYGTVPCPPIQLGSGYCDPDQ
ncbi:GDCCVxC domain-containing (seleno)protein [Halomonas daqiaonensis]|uniref:GDCCVxC domain-containing (seleno)protein n=1 Tax=Halomonas daqiaonensis TaxID=650850 RepID=UPI00244E637A|nr:GDCCVxC domain-containing (seleno)protein [Halomonas daqiaonensis]